jgi:hypothetical protein
MSALCQKVITNRGCGLPAGCRPELTVVWPTARVVSVARRDWVPIVVDVALDLRLAVDPAPLWGGGGARTVICSW